MSLIILLTEKVLRFEISMHYVQLVHVIERKAQLLDDRSGLPLRECFKLVNLLKEIAAADQLHDDVIVAIVLHQLEDTCDVRVHRVLKHSEFVFVQLLVDIGDLQA